MIRISITDQTLSHRLPTGVWHHYPISSASKGCGNQQGSWQTPLGKHRIHQKIGQGEPTHTFFRARKAMGIYQVGSDDPTCDWILTRILWLEGVQTGINKRGKVDTRSRYIYIHGTHEEHRIGEPASHGCIRMRNRDLIQLFDDCQLHESVNIHL